MKLIIAGSRSVNPTDEQITEAFHTIRAGAIVTEIICGMARGADLAGKRWAHSCGVTVYMDPVTDEDYDKFGRYIAPKMRNRRMAERAGAAIIFWDGLSGGSSDMCMRMVARGKPVLVIPLSPTKHFTP